MDNYLKICTKGIPEFGLYCFIKQWSSAIFPSAHFWPKSQGGRARAWGCGLFIPSDRVPSCLKGPDSQLAPLQSPPAAWPSPSGPLHNRCYKTIPGSRPPRAMRVRAAFKEVNENQNTNKKGAGLRTSKELPWGLVHSHRGLTKACVCEFSPTLEGIRGRPPCNHRDLNRSLGCRLQVPPSGVALKGYG